jgi:hypothetical protein
MSYRIFFELSFGLSTPIIVPKGTLSEITKHIQKVENELGFKTEQFKDNQPHWVNTEPKNGISNEQLCNIAEEHNTYVRWLYGLFERCTKEPPKDGEAITPEDAAKFWHGLQLIDVPIEKWNGDYYQQRMIALYEAMRGRETEGNIFDSKPLTAKQAGDVINLFAQYLDLEDIRLDVPIGQDYLTNEDYDHVWCDKCGGLVTYQHAYGCKKRKCYLKEEGLIETNKEN